MAYFEKILSKTSNIEFLDLLKVFKNTSNSTNIKMSDYYKSPETDINTLFIPDNYINNTGTVLNIIENVNIPLTGQAISIVQFKNAKQYRISNTSYNNTSTTDNTSIINSIITSLLPSKDYYDIIKIQLNGNEIYSDNNSIGAININTNDLLNCFSINLYCNTFITGCHGKYISGTQTNANGINGGNGGSSTNAGPCIKISGTNNTIKLNIKKNNKLSGGFGGNGGAGGNAGRNTIAFIAANDEESRIDYLNQTITNYEPDIGNSFLWNALIGYTITTGVILVDGYYYYIQNSVFIGKTTATSIIKVDNATRLERWEVETTVRLSGTKSIFNKMDSTSNKWYDDNKGQSWLVNGCIVYRIYYATWDKSKVITRAQSDGDPGQIGYNGENGAYGTYPINKVNNSNNIFGSINSGKARDGTVATGRSIGNIGIGGTNGISGIEVNNTVPGFTPNLY
jgi:hypothetical protein